MHTKYTICCKSYKDKISQFQHGAHCVPRTLAKKTWGGEENLVRCIKNGSCCLKDLGGTEFVEWKDGAEEKILYT